LGFFFDDKVEEMAQAGLFQQRQLPISVTAAHDASLAFWMPYAAYENAKRWPLFPVMLFFIVCHALFADLIAPVVATIKVGKPGIVGAVMGPLYKEFIEHHPTPPEEHLNHPPGIDPNPPTDPRPMSPWLERLNRWAHKSDENQIPRVMDADA
jgi:hypothetical protein